ncbi:MAG TPA: histidinol-phosphatase [Firmicutes bacterium]|nr:histidinol-phosphatase [Bacillota bacterium]
MQDWSLFADWHTHTRFSDGTGTIRANALAGQARGLRQVAITDHAPGSLGVGIKKPLETIRQMRAEIDAWNAEGNEPQLLLGVETNLISRQGDLDLPAKLLKQLDVVIASLHPLVKPLTWRDGATMLLPNAIQRFTRLRSRKLRNTNTKALVEAVYRYPISFVAHPGLWIDIDTEELAQACVRRNTALEINCLHTDILADYVRVAMPSGVDFIINSDAHCPAQVGQLEAGRRLAEKLGLPPERIRNAEQRGEKK